MAAAGALEIAGAEDLQESVFEGVVDPAVRRRQMVDEDAQMYGMASNIVSSIGTLVGENYAAPVIEGISRATSEIDKGKDLETATALGATEGVVVGASLALPFSLPAKGAYRYLTKVGYGVVSSVGVGELGRQTELSVLESGGYMEEAEQLREGANRQRAIELAMGLFFGGAAAGYARYADAKMPRQHEVDAAMIANARAADDAANPMQDFDPEAAAAHSDALQAVRAENEAGGNMSQERMSAIVGDDDLPQPARDLYDANRQAAVGALRETSDDAADVTTQALDTPQPRQSQQALPRWTAEGGAPEVVALVDEVTAANWLGGQKKAVSYAVEQTKLAGLPTVGMRHTVDSFAIRKILKDHGDDAVELPRGQLPVTKEDIAKIPEIVSAFDKVESAGTNARGQDLVRYTKRYNGKTFYVEEVRTGRKELAAVTMWKTRTTNPGEGIPLDRNLPQATNESVLPEAGDVSQNFKPVNPEGKEAGFSLDSVMDAAERLDDLGVRMLDDAGQAISPAKLLQRLSDQFASVKDAEALFNDITTCVLESLNG